MVRQSIVNKMASYNLETLNIISSCFKNDREKKKGTNQRKNIINFSDFIRYISKKSDSKD